MIDCLTNRPGRFQRIDWLTLNLGAKNQSLPLPHHKLHLRKICRHHSILQVHKLPTTSVSLSLFWDFLIGWAVVLFCDSAQWRNNIATFLHIRHFKLNWKQLLFRKSLCTCLGRQSFVACFVKLLSKDLVHIVISETLLVTHLWSWLYFS